MQEVVKETGGYRVVLEPDMYAEEPYDEGQSPLIRFGDRSTGTIHLDTFSKNYGSDAYVNAAAHKWGPPNRDTWNLFEKYLRIFHGVTQIETYYSGSYWYVTYDSAVWRESVGAPEGSASLAEYKAYCEGEVYSYVVQKRVTWTALNPVADKFAERDTWEDVDSCSGYYGYGYAVQAALEALEVQTGDATAAAVGQ